MLLPVPTTANLEKVLADKTVLKAQKIQVRKVGTLMKNLRA